MSIGVLRIFMGWIMLWTFLDKLFGLGFATESGKSWLDGTSPTAGFLEFGTKGPLAGVFQSLAGVAAIDRLFMLGLLLIGLALILGIGVKIAGYSGAVLMLLIFLAFMPPEHNPILDEHIIYLVVFKFLALSKSGNHLGLGKAWSKVGLVQKYPILQ